jgi:hypothetical protein
VGPVAGGVHGSGGTGELIGDGEPAAAELLPDRGAAAETDDFFRSRAFYDAEGVTHTLRVGSGAATIALPVLVRDLADPGLADAVSPYGYPGGAISKGGGAPPDPAAIEWSGTGLVSVFIRERLGADPCLAGATLRSTVQVHDPSRDRRLRGRFAEQIRRNTRLGYRVEVIPGPEATAEQRSSFHSIYSETMERAGAEERYFFDLRYLGGVLAFEGSWLILCTHADGSVPAGAIAGLSDGLLHYYLGGTAGARLGDSPFKNVVDAMVGLADQMGAPLNLGGGVRPGDGLEDFKRGFANAELPFHTHEIVCDRAAYDRLSGGRAGGDYFPAYRAPAG